MEDNAHVNRVQKLFVKIEMANDMRTLERDRRERLARIASSPKRIYEHLTQSRGAYVATGAFFGEEDEIASKNILAEIVSDMRAMGMYSQKYIDDMIGERNALRTLCESYVNDNDEVSAKSARTAATKLLRKYHASGECIKRLEEDKKKVELGKKQDLADREMVDKVRAKEITQLITDYIGTRYPRYADYCIERIKDELQHGSLSGNFDALRDKMNVEGFLAAVDKEFEFERAIENMCRASGRDLEKERHNPREDLSIGDGR
jgi:hypothetical protein